MKKNKLLMATALFSLVAGLVACGDTPMSSSSGSSSESISESSSSSSEYIPVYTEALTDAMLADLKLGYAATAYRSTSYTDGSGSNNLYELRSTSSAFALKQYSTVEGNPTQKSKLAYDYQYQPGDETYPKIYEVGLSVGNTLINTPVIGRDPFTGEDVESLWSEANVDNFFAFLSASDFTRVGDENKFALNLTSDNFVVNNVADKIMRQFLEPNLYWGLDPLPNTTFDYFHLLTDGDAVVGFDFQLVPYLSAESYATQKCYGDFTDAGADVLENVKVLEGQEDPEFAAAINKLKAQNYKMVQKQSGRTLFNDKVSYLGMYQASVENGEKLVYDVYDSSDSKIMNFGYYDLEETGEETGRNIKQGVTKIKDNFFKEYIYYDKVEDFLPEFNFSSLLFNKNAELSTETKAVWELNKDIKISEENDSTNYTPFEADGYADRTIYMTITIEEDKITISNRTSNDSSGEFGLMMDIEFTELGSITNLIPESSIKETAEGLTWVDLVSNEEAELTKVLNYWTEENINSVPQLDPIYTLINLDATTPQQPLFFVVMYSEEEIDEVIASYSETLLTNGYSYVDDTIADGEDAPAPNFVRNTNVTTSNGKTYSLNVSINKFWNGNPGYEYGQLQIRLSYGKAI